MATRVPKKDSEFDPYIRNTTTVLETGIPLGAVRLGLTVGQGTQWLGFRDQWIAVYPKYTNSATRTTTITNAKNTIKKEFTLFAEKPLKLIEASDNLTADDRGTFKLPERDRTVTRKGKITEMPFASIQSLGAGQMQFRVRTTTDGSRASMHPLADLIEVRYMIGAPDNGNPPNPNPNPKDSGIPTADKAPYYTVSKKALFILEVGLGNAGKPIIAFVRWANASNAANNGPWSQVTVAIIT